MIMAFMPDRGGKGVLLSLEGMVPENRLDYDELFDRYQKLYREKAELEQQKSRKNVQRLNQLKEEMDDLKQWFKRSPFSPV